jgi:hypothetical protein
MSIGQLEPVIYSKDSAPLDFRDLTHMYCLDHDCQQLNKCHCLLINLHSSKCCAWHGDCQNISETVVDNDSDDNLDWLCSCNLQWTLDLKFNDNIAEECVYF